MFYVCSQQGDITPQSPPPSPMHTTTATTEGRRRRKKKIYVFHSYLCPVLMCVCVCARACVCVHVHACMCVCMCMHACVCVCVCVCAHACVCVHACVHVCVCTPILSKFEATFQFPLDLLTSLPGDGDLAQSPGSHRQVSDTHTGHPSWGWTWRS